jgi:anti-anti-sigma regulatory factor
MQETEGYGGKFLLAGLQQPVWNIFESLRLDEVFEVFPDAAAALAETSIRVTGRRPITRMPAPRRVL